MANPTYKSQGGSLDMTKFQILKKRINSLKDEIERKQKDVSRLDQKEEFYLKEIEKLKKEHENNKKRILDEGNALGFAEPVTRQFYK